MNPLNGVGGLGGYSASLKAPTTKSKRLSQTFLGERKAGQRVQTIDRKLMKLIETSRLISIPDPASSMDFYHLTIDQAVDAFGDYNPLYGGRPKKLTQILLNMLPSATRMKEFALQKTGLIYGVPALTGVRAFRGRTTVAGLGLLEHWAEKYPNFKPFLLAYNTTKARDEITADCFDLAMGMRPVAFKEMDALNKIYRTKWEAREYRRLMKEEAARRSQLVATTSMGSQAYAQQMAHAQQLAYVQQQLAHAQSQSQHTFSNSSGNYVSNNGFDWNKI